MNNRSFAIFIIIILALGLFVGYQISFWQILDTGKLLNIIGLFYNLLGVVVLSEIVLSSPKLREISVNWIAPFVLWIHMVIPLGTFLGAMLAYGATSALSVSKFAIGFLIYSIIPLGLLEVTVVFPRYRTLQYFELRYRYFGLFLFLTGIALQLVAAVKGL